MAGKKQKKTELSYLQAYLPEAGRRSKVTKVDFGGLCEVKSLDTGMISDEENISTECSPYIVPAQKKRLVYNAGDTSVIPAALYAYGDMLIEIYASCSKTIDELSATDTVTMRCTHLARDGEQYSKAYSYTVNGTFEKASIDSATNQITYNTSTGDVQYLYSDFISKITARSMCIFNYAVNTANLYSTELAPYILFYPERSSFNLSMTSFISVPAYESEKATKRQFTDKTKIYYAYNYGDPSKASQYISYWNRQKHVGYYIWQEKSDGAMWRQWSSLTGIIQNKASANLGNAYPNIKYAVTYNGRVFGVDDSKIYVSGYNDYANWNLDTASEFNADNAWVSITQANNKSVDDVITGITAYGGSVYIFTGSRMQEIYGTKNPFRIRDTANVGCIDNRSIQTVDGRLIFVSKDAVRMYNGTGMYAISGELDVSRFENAVAGEDGRRYYLYCKTDKREHNLYVYDTANGRWTREAVDTEILSFAKTDDGLFMMDVSGKIYKINSGDYDHDWWFETELFTMQSADIKHIKKIQFLADAAPQASINVHILYDDEKFSESASQLVYSNTNTENEAKRLAVRFLPRKTAAHGFKIRISGHGYVKLYQAEIYLQEGGDLYVTV